MSWKNILPPEIDIDALSLDDCRNFKKFHALMDSITNDVKGPPGFRIFYQLMHYLLFYGVCCINENKFPALNKCWNKLSPLFLTDSYDCEWLVHCWIFCDFPLNENTNDVLLDHFSAFLLENPEIPTQISEHIKQFCSIMKTSRLGLYQEILSTSKVTKYKELFSNNSISTVRSVPYYESGEIFLTRIVSFLGDTFSIHNSKSFPSEFKNNIEDMVKNKLFYVSETEDVVSDYELFMKLAGPYWMSCTHEDPSSPILQPDEYKYFYVTNKEKLTL